MDVIRLRTMTEKSIIGFGKYTDLTVRNLIDQRKTTELRWIYYNCSLLTFKPEILEFLGIVDEYVIEKPGKNPDMYEKLQQYKFSRMHGIDRLKSMNHSKKVHNSKFVGFIKKDSMFFSKANMQARNQGR